MVKNVAPKRTLMIMKPVQKRTLPSMAEPALVNANRMIYFHKLIATCFGVGYIGKGAGTIAAALYSIIYYLFTSQFHQGFGAIIFTILLIILGIWCSNKLEFTWGKDNGKIVIDELAGMQISLLFIPPTILNISIAFVFFRFFDILKPFYIKKMEKLNNGWGVMLDDVLAGIYTNILLQILLVIHLVE